MADQLIGILPPVPTCACILLVATILFLGVAASLLRNLAPQGTRRGLCIQVTGSAAAHRALVEHSAAFLNRPIGVIPSSILTAERHNNIMAAPYGPYWRAVRRNVTAGVLHPSNLTLLGDTRARVLRRLVRDLRSGAPAAESIYFSVYSLIAEMCFGEEVVSELGETRLRAMHKLQTEFLSVLLSFGVFVRYPRIGKFLYPWRWRQVLALRRWQEESYLRLVAEVKKKNNTDRKDDSRVVKTYVESLLDLRIPEEGGRALTDGEVVSLISEFLGAGTETTASTLQWTMANLIKRPDLQQKLRAEVDAVACDQRGIIEEPKLSCMPYLKATVLESLRRHPPLPFVLRHMGREVAAKVLGLTTVPEGGAAVNFLVGKIGRDPAAWSEPTEFIPERFMSTGGDCKNADLTCIRELRMMPFGAGRRACPAIAPAMLHLEYFLANLIKEFEWWEADGDGNAVDLTEFHGSFVTKMNRPLRARLVPLQAE
ncbi:cytochrome P450 89A2-like [Lolium rigidum]|uniref:cytochrome P450 89A2-like n=1 Tax=Lolium rigidum TaxID=89674 RepID=UPI001F5DFE96|nr:cytochrome P450 89A2-like [Lolium rigidum]